MQFAIAGDTLISLYAYHLSGDKKKLGSNFVDLTIVFSPKTLKKNFGGIQKPIMVAHLENNSSKYKIN